ncbi:capsular biosynthesis protein [Sphingomonas sp. Leaf33]|nr:capsular biosynthesis protein [Sphingomonas sp. Leaf33]
MLVATVAVEALARPHAGTLRSARGVAVHLLVVTAAFGTCLMLLGGVPVAAGLAAALVALLVVASNAKHAVLGEPLIFSDLALIGALVSHPRFYFTAIPRDKRWVCAIGALAVVAGLAALFTPRLPAHLAGAGIALGALAALRGVVDSRWLAATAATPDLDRDVAQHGLFAVLLLYWWRWRREGDPAPLPPLDTRVPPAPEIVVVVQCESFADPVDLTGDAALALPALAAARAAAWQCGDLNVSGFGAYTMRTEYGVLFGRSEDALGFRRYDPFLTAAREASHALPMRLRGAGYHGRFVHPHDLRFYNRHRLMPAIGFDELTGEAAFASPPVGQRYVDDRSLAAMLGGMVTAAQGPTLIYAVTMENHGPWDGGTGRGDGSALAAYLRHVRSSDAMLGDLIDRLHRDGRSALLVFFGDHRPSIPGASLPGGDRHTPYVMLRFGRGADDGARPGRVDLTPAELHHAILRAVAGGGVSPAA